MLACGNCWRFTVFPFRNCRRRIHLRPKPSSRRLQSIKRSEPERKSRCFEACFAGERMSTPRQWENDDGRHGYVPAHVKDWKAINKSRPEDRRKVAHNTRKFLPMTGAVIEQHLLGEETIGVY